MTTPSWTVITQLGYRTSEAMYHLNKLQQIVKFRNYADKNCKTNLEVKNKDKVYKQ